MKKIFIGLIGIIGLMGFISCDKIEEGEYTVYDGAKVTWSTAAASLTPVQRVYVEKFTGPRCSNCPLADATLSTIHNERVVMVSINHPTGQGTPYPEQPDMRTDGGTVWDKWFGVNAIPAAYINRDLSRQYLGDMSNIVGAINQALTVQPVIALEASAYGAIDEVDVVIELQFVKDYTQPLTVTVALVEDSLVYRQLLPDNSIDDNYVHNHMLRKVATGFWGADVEASGTAGEALMGRVDFSVDSDVNLEKSHVVVFLSDKATRKVLNCVQCNIIFEVDEK
jgi:hypothetical protein